MAYSIDLLCGEFLFYGVELFPIMFFLFESGLAEPGD